MYMKRKYRNNMLLYHEISFYFKIIMLSRWRKLHCRLKGGNSINILLLMNKQMQGKNTSIIMVCGITQSRINNNIIPVMLRT